MNCLFLLFLLLFFSPIFVVAGGASAIAIIAAGVPSCMTMCAGFSSFFGPLFGGAYVGCLVACATALGFSVPATCFDPNTKVFIMNGNGTNHVTMLRDVDVGSYILTHNVSPIANGISQSLVYTRVIENTLQVGVFAFVNIKTVNNKSLNVTKDHVMMVHRYTGESFTLLLTSAANLQIEDYLINDKEEKEKIIGLTLFNLSNKMVLHTEAGTVLADGILTTTMCGDELQPSKPMLFKAKWEDWAQRHGVSIL